MRKILLSVVVALALVAPVTAKAQTMSIVAGALLGGLAGSVYVNGLNATAATVSAAAVSTANAIAAAAPPAASAVAGAVAGASAPVILGVVAGGAIGYLIFR